MRDPSFGARLGQSRVFSGGASARGGARKRSVARARFQPAIIAEEIECERGTWAECARARRGPLVSGFTRIAGCAPDDGPAWFLGPLAARCWLSTGSRLGDANWRRFARGRFAFLRVLRTGGNQCSGWPFLRIADLAVRSVVEIERIFTMSRLGISDTRRGKERAKWIGPHRQSLWAFEYRKTTKIQDFSQRGHPSWKYHKLVRSRFLKISEKAFESLEDWLFRFIGFAWSDKHEKLAYNVLVFRTYNQVCVFCSSVGAQRCSKCKP